MISKEVFPGIDVLTSPGEAFLRNLGVTFFDNLVGNFVIPSMAEDTATFPGEDASAASASMAPASLTLAARRVTHTQAISKETLVQTSPTVYSSIVQNLIDGIWKAISYDVMDTVASDCGVSQTESIGTYPTFTNIVNMEASTLGLDLKSPAYVATPALKSYLTVTAYMTNQVGIWKDDMVNGYPAYSTPAQNTNVITFGDWSKMAVGLWGPIEIVVDPFTDAKKGLINLTAVALVDTGCYNKRGFKIFTNASTA
jgi:hypothetical protein